MLPTQAMTFEEKFLSCRALMKYCEKVSNTSSNHLFTTTPTPHFMNTSLQVLTLFNNNVPSSVQQNAAKLCFTSTLLQQIAAAFVLQCPLTATVVLSQNNLLSIIASKFFNTIIVSTAKLLHSVTVCSPQFLVVYEGCSKSQYSWNFCQRLSWTLSEGGTIVQGTVWGFDSTCIQICAIHLPFLVIISISITYCRSPLLGKPFLETNFGFTTYCQGMRAFHEIKIWCTGNQ